MSISSSFYEVHHNRSFKWVSESEAGERTEAECLHSARKSDDETDDSSVSVKPGIDEQWPTVLSSFWYDLAGARSAPRTDAHCCPPPLCIAVHPSFPDRATSHRLLLPTFASTLYIIIVARENRTERDLDVSVNYFKKKNARECSRSIPDELVYAVWGNNI